MTGSAELISGEIAEDITNYLFVSEQTPSSVGLGVLVDTDGAAKAAGGFFLQTLPDIDDEILNIVEENIKKLPPVSTLISEGKSAEDILKLLLNGAPDFEMLTKTDVSFRCKCSRERIEEVLISTGEKELKSLIADGRAEVVCHFCGEKYEFNKDDLEMLLRVTEKAKKWKEEHGI